MYDASQCRCPHCGSSRLGVKQREYWYYELDAVNPDAERVEVGAIINDYWWLDESCLFCRDCDEDIPTGDVIVVEEAADSEQSS